MKWGSIAKKMDFSGRCIREENLFSRRCISKEKYFLQRYISEKIFSFGNTSTRKILFHNNILTKKILFLNDTLARKKNSQQYVVFQCRKIFFVAKCRHRKFSWRDISARREMISSDEGYIGAKKDYFQR
jgi:hypothetical protein